MADQSPVIVVVAPLFAALLAGLIGMREKRACLPLTLLGLVVSLSAAIVLFRRVLAEGEVRYFLGGWDKPLGIGIELRIDTVNGLVLIVIAIVSLISAIFSFRPHGQRDTEKNMHFYILFLLLCAGLFGITATADAFNLYVLVEVSSLTSYALVAMGSLRRGTVAAFNYIIMGTIGASFYLLGVGYLYMQTGALNMEGIRVVVNQPDVLASKAVLVAFVFILTGVWIKTAFFPLHGWLPNAYAYAPTTSSTLLAPLMTKVFVYVMIRIMLSVFGLVWVFEHLSWSHIVVWLSVIAILAGSIIALTQTELKKMLGFLIIAEVGYMVGGAWLADEGLWGFKGAIYHIVSDAFMTSCLFIAAGIFYRRHDCHDIASLDGAFKRMPLTMTGLLVGGLAMIGVPPTCGFFSKWYLIRGGIDSGHWGYVVALIISSLVNAVLFFRIFEIAFFGKKPVEHADHGDSHGHGEEHAPAPAEPTGQAPMPTALVALMLSAGFILLIGIFNGQIMEWISLTVDPLNPFTKTPPL